MGQKKSSFSKREDTLLPFFLGQRRTAVIPKVLRGCTMDWQPQGNLISTFLFGKLQPMRAPLPHQGSDYRLQKTQFSTSFRPVFLLLRTEYFSTI